ncbi:MFS transporter [Dyadobacter sp. 3J3]|uniref:MFS transporter n=1 Tax=Dyadobacter sp. 3J3 TaxID=2606600 RepID=UPI00135841A0|nr:MFS transporter [Dyadobacter sp. 3J3]
MKPVYFKNWITGWSWGVRIALFLMLLSGLAHLGMFVMTQNYLVGYLGAQPEDISFAIMSTYAGIITVLPVQFRFFKYFETKGYLLISIMLAIFLDGLCLYCQDINLFLVIRFFQGLLAANVIVFSLMLIFSQLPPQKVQIIGPAVFYGTMLSNIVLIGLVGGFVVESADWKVTYYYLILFELLTMVMVLMMLRKSSGHKPYPLYQIDWQGMILFGCGALAVAYTTIYGSKYYWFSDARICFSAFAAVVGVSLFLYRQHMVKRPVIHLGVFKSVNFVVALCLLAIYYGSKDSVNLGYNYAGGVLKWSTLQVIELGLCNMSAMVGMLVFSIQMLLAKKSTIRVLLVAGFGLLSTFNGWMSILLTPDLSFTDLLLPVFVQGMASGLLFVPIMMSVLSSAPAGSGMSGLILAACTRFTATLHSFAGFYNMQLYFNQYYKEGFLTYLSLENQNTITWLDSYRSGYISKGFSADQASSLASGAIWQSLTQQSQLLTNRAVFMIFGVLLAAVAVLILVIPAIKKTFVDWKRLGVVCPGQREVGSGSAV